MSVLKVETGQMLKTRTSNRFHITVSEIERYPRVNAYKSTFNGSLITYLYLYAKPLHWTVYEKVKIVWLTNWIRIFLTPNDQCCNIINSRVSVVAQKQRETTSDPDDIFVQNINHTDHLTDNTWNHNTVQMRVTII